MWNRIKGKMNGFMPGWSNASSQPISASAPSVNEVDRPLPTTDTNAYIVRGVRARLNKNKDTYAPNLLAFAEHLFNELQNPAFLSKNPSLLEKAEVAQDANRAFIESHLAIWNSTSQAPVNIDEDNVNILDGLFSGMITGIRTNAELQNNKEHFLKLLEWDMVNLSPPQSRFTSTVPQATIQIDQHVKALSDLYAKWVDDYEKLKKRPQDFVSEANQILNSYFDELLKINLREPDEAKRRWAMAEIQQALSYYFDQRELLFRIYSSTAIIPLSTTQIEKEIVKMRPYVQYIKEMFARQEDYSRTLSLGSWVLNCGYDRMTKINAALDLYHSICNLPEDRPMDRDPEVQAQITQAKNNGRLYRLSLI